MSASRAFPAILSLLALLALTSCDGPDPHDDGGADAGPQPAGPLIDYASGAVWDGPWPDERMRSPDGTIALEDFARRRPSIVDKILEVLDGAPGFGTSSTIFFPLTAAIDPSSLPRDVHESVDPAASVFLVDVDPTSDERGARQPFDARFDVDPGPLAPPNLLALLPLQGRPLHPNRLYAAVVTTRVLAADGAPLSIAPETAALARGEQPSGLSDAAFDAHREAMTALDELGVDTSEVAAVAVFRTWDPMAELAEARAQVLDAATPEPNEAFTVREVFDDYCVFHTTIDMPVYQGGDAPYSSSGGGWVRGEDGRLELQTQARSNVWVTLPRATMPADGFPAAVFIRTGGGGDRPLVDRGRHPALGEEAAPGTGPAMHFARAGFAGVSVDGPLGGLRNPDGWDEQFAIFNINNPRALRDNIRQSAIELVLFAHVLPHLTIDASSCPDLAIDEVRLDTSTLTLMGHSMGATIAPLVAALEPRYRAMILSGAGASWIANVIYKESPIAVRPAANALLGYGGRHEITAHDPVLALLQWAGETADPQVYGRAVVDAPRDGEPRHVLMFQGVLDTYIPPPVANALSLALGLDLGGEPLVLTRPEHQALAPLLPLADADVVALPSAGNHSGGTATALIVQHAEDGIEDGHEVVYQRVEPQLQYRCFLETLVGGVPRVVAPDAAGCAD